MRTKSKSQMGLSFDDEPPPILEWREVPQHIFLSWSDKLQYEYCAKRDINSALLENSDWYRERAVSYREYAQSL